MPAVSTSASATNRLEFVDLLRGTIVAVMALDHASLMFNAGRAAEELAGQPAPLFGSLAQFLTRFSQVPIAPGFFFIAGFMVALTTSWREAQGLTQREVNRHLLIRGLVLLAADLIVFGIPRATQGFYSFVVLSSIGVAIMLLALIRQWPMALLFILAVATIILHPLINLSAWPVGLRAILHDAVRAGPIRSLYPIIPWSAILLCGFLTGRHFLLRGPRPGLWCAIAALSFATFFAIRLAGGYGNAYPTAPWNTIAFWTFAKYPPDLAFLSWSFAWIFAGLALMYVIARNGVPKILMAIQVFGRVPLFFYIAHFVVLGIAAFVVRAKFGLLATYGIWLALLLLMLWPCAYYYRLKRERPNFFTRYI